MSRKVFYMIFVTLMISLIFERVASHKTDVRLICWTTHKSYNRIERNVGHYDKEEV